MDKETQSEITNALDRAIVATAKKDFSRLSDGLSPQQIAKEIHRALRSLEGLKWGSMPKYGEWEALFYILWHQPEHINLAYTLAKHVLKIDSVSIHDAGDLEVYDFGSGALAMQFGLALATADTLGADRPPPCLTVKSSDTSKPMMLIGQKLWNEFKREMTIGGYPNMATVRRVCSPLRSTFSSGWTASPAWVRFSFVSNHDSTSKSNRWLTAMHVAYEDIHVEVTRELNDWVSKWNPSRILVTAQPEAFQWAFSPVKNIYSSDQRDVMPADLKFEGDFQRTFKFRKQLFVDHVGKAPDALDDDDMFFTRNYLTILPTSWVTPKSFGSRVATFRRK